MKQDLQGHTCQLVYWLISKGNRIMLIDPVIV